MTPSRADHETMDTSADQRWFEERLLERFLRYVRFPTTSDRRATTVPTTENQRTFVGSLAEELRGFGLSDVSVDEHAFLIARMPANPGPKRRPATGRLPAPRAPCVGFMAHVDTTEEVPGTGVNPQVHRDYAGTPLALSAAHILDPADFPELLSHRGDTIVTSDGSTLLGADDKAGVAEIMTAAEYLAAHPDIPHGEIEIILTPDEETGLAMPIFPQDRIRSRFCYTLDGSEEGTIEAECFEAYRAIVRCAGRSIHLGTARGKLVNAVEMAVAFAALIPRSESPEATDRRYGYYCPLSIKGEVEKAEIEIYIRDFDERECQRRIEVLKAAAVAVEKAFAGGTVTVEMKKQYANMKRYVDEHPRVMELLEEAIRMTGLEPKRKEIRGGTDGSRLSEMGVPTPNVFTGGGNYHSRLEWVSLRGMTRAAMTVVHLARLWARAGEATEAARG